MNENSKETKRKLKEIYSVKDLIELLDATLLTADEREIVWKVYKEGKTLDFVADEMGMSKASVSRKHKSALHKIGKMFK